ncbi:adenylyl-sulfate kinase [Marinobacter nauticus]|uniref:Adenylyl-sulfate kinase n=1 Tax=Marinobacter nauticus (strain ATCC 700491 / DSM 11845 / VT8) TaxID=351348 RepID=CYSC_MARN8|nr:RecName: Full=Adenylyl-sulfate kinase; AltName: Full=APS kinase; AltName: Full=ATP adenosine-5'-phosphosulfate 3'-phosphotransferase; AltName: Full=Adenosine-5'-phosphosulfate kinase [Marinobacter nauticus VT8]ABM19697.1 adenylylsulfate kinase [Marinobacter nauticus VT8]RKR77538.1 adenylylsulfate kinase [Marinobacter nauticus]
MSNIVWHDHKVTRAERSANKNQKPCLLWFTGLSGSGKSTIANALDVALHERGYHTFLLDGDNVRHGLCSDLGFSDDDRVENIRRVGEVCKLFADAGLIVMSAFISPFTSDRRMVRKLFPAGEFIEVFMDAPLETCESRDPKGLYKKARAGEIKHFTGIDSPYEVPSHPEIRLDTSQSTVDECVDSLIAYLQERELIKSN